MTKLFFVSQITKMFSRFFRKKEQFSFFCKSNYKNVFLDFFKKKEQFTDSAVAFNKTREILKIATRLNGHRVFFPQRQLTNFEV